MIEGLSAYLKANPALALLLICHVLGDFHLQGPELARRKNTELTYLGYHLGIVSFLLVLAGLLLPKLWLILLLVAISHAGIDYAKPKIQQGLGLSPAGIFALDQILHLLILIGLSLQAPQLTLPAWLSGQLLNSLLFFLLITKPVNVAFRIFFRKYQPEEDPAEAETIQGAGAVIGLLERIVMAVCLAFGQFSSIGLVFTAKSIARYNKIAENPAFAEYYLIGSLFSILTVLAAAWLCLF